MSKDIFRLGIREIDRETGIVKIEIITPDLSGNVYSFYYFLGLSETCGFTMDLESFAKEYIQEKTGELEKIIGKLVKALDRSKELLEQYNDAFIRVSEVSDFINELGELLDE